MMKGHAYFAWPFLWKNLLKQKIQQRLAIRFKLNKHRIPITVGGCLSTDKA